jgi:hypothetical protein
MKVSSKVSTNGEVEPCNQQSIIILEATRMSLGSNGDGKVKRMRTTTRCQRKLERLTDEYNSYSLG